MNLRELFLPEYDQEMANTRRTLERVPEEKFTWKPHDKSMSLHQLATHLATIPGYLAVTIGHDEFDIAPPGGEPYKAPNADSTKALLELFDKGVAEGRKALESADDDLLSKPWALKRGGETMFSFPRFMVVRNFVLNHMVHHRAQLGVYLRENDVPVPSIYGPSADESN